MRDFFKSTKFKILVCVLALIVGIMLYSASNSGSESGASIFGTIFKPIQKFSSSVTNKVESSLDMLLNASKYYDDNKKLKEQLNEYYKKVVDYENLKEENEQLRSVIGLKEQFPDYEFSPPCSVISRTTNDPFGSFTIDRGTDDGIAQYDPVITKDGLVGIVTKVSKTYSRVQTILSPEVPVGAYCIRTKDTGVVEGDTELAKKGYCKMIYLSRESTLEVGDIIVSSGNSGLFPIDRIIGTVEEIKPEENGLSLTATIKPVVDVNQVSNVFVITSFKGQGEGYEQ